MQTIVSPTMSDTEQRPLTANWKALSLGESSQSSIWKCFVLIYHIQFKIDFVSSHLQRELTPWRRATNIDKESMSEEGRKTMAQFDKEMSRFRKTMNVSTQWSESEWQQIMQVYRKLWPFKGPTPEALDWWSLSTRELLQAVPWNNLLISL